VGIDIEDDVWGMGRERERERERGTAPPFISPPSPSLPK
jgi:hypothetical protein